MTINRPKNIDALEAEILALEANDGIADEERIQEAEQKAQEPAPQTSESPPEEGNWQKRYGDLRKLDQRKADEIKALKAEIEKLKSVPQDSPLNAESVKKWIKDNPQATAIIKALALDEVAPKFKEVDSLRQEVQKDKDRIRIIQAHTDFDEVVASDDFNFWANKQPKSIQNLIFDNGDVDNAIWAVSTYKEATAKGDGGKSAATAIKKGTVSEPKGGANDKYLRESEIEAMSLPEYEKRQDEIAEAQRSGRIIYDLSGAAR